MKSPLYRAQTVNHRGHRGGRLPSFAPQRGCRVGDPARPQRTLFNKLCVLGFATGESLRVLNDYQLRSQREGERGAALVTALMAMLLLTALGFALVLTTNTETMIAGNYRSSQEALYAADAAIERTMQDLLTVPDWNNVLSGATKSAFTDGDPGPRTLPDGKILNLNYATNMINCGKTTPDCNTTEMNTVTEDRSWGTNNPRWQLYAYGPVNNLLPTGTINSDLYVVVWVGDDPSENDGDPTKDGNSQTNLGTGVITLRAEAFGPGGSRKVVEVTLARTDSTEIERGYTGQRGQDEQNRRARKAAVQTPGLKLGQQALTLATGTIQ